MTSKFQRYPHHMMLELDYGFISSLNSTIYHEICLNEQQVTILKSVLEMAYWPTRWIDLAISKRELAYLIADIDYRLNGQDDCMSNNCVKCYVDKQALITEITNNYATYNTWNDEFNTSGGVSISTQVSTDIKRGQGHDAATDSMLCYMAELYVNALCDGLIEQSASEGRDGMDAYADVLEAVAGAFGLAALLVPAAGVTGLAAAGIGVIVASAVARVLPANVAPIVDALSDPVARNEVICCMAGWLTSVTVILNLASWEGNIIRNTAAGGVCDQTSWSDNGKALRAFLRPIVATTEQYISFYRTLDDFLWLGAASDGLLPACVCDDWCYLFDFTIDDGGWEQKFDTDLYGVYDPGVGWKMETKPGDERACYIGTETANLGTVTRVDVYITIDMTGCETIRTDQIWLGVDDFDWPAADTYRLVRTNLDCPCGENQTFVYTAEPSSPVDANWFGAIITRYADSADGWITAVKYSGKGANPFGADNC